jgi:predicted transposase YdaD
MNPGMVGVFIPVIAMLGVFSLLLARSPVGQALADRLRHGPTPRGRSGGSEENAELLENVEQLRREVAELAERVDFTERLLAKSTSKERDVAR